MRREEKSARYGKEEKMLKAGQVEAGFFFQMQGPAMQQAMQILLAANFRRRILRTVQGNAKSCDA
jgi:hypothetical protein